jgi:hypothetical protein
MTEREELIGKGPNYLVKGIVDIDTGRPFDKHTGNPGLLLEDLKGDSPIAVNWFKIATIELAIPGMSLPGMKEGQIATASMRIEDFATKQVEFQKSLLGRDPHENLTLRMVNEKWAQIISAFRLH